MANGPRTVASPDGKSIAFISDRSGWAHLYVIPYNATSETQAKQLSKGDFGDGFAAWSPDSKKVAFAHSEPGNQQERFISVADVATGKITPIVTAHGVNYEPLFSADGLSIAYLRSAVEHPQEVYMIAASAGAKPVRLTDSLPAEINVADLTAPVAVHYPSRKDQKPVPATLMVDKNLDKTKKHPAIIWIHGSGADQNYLGWHPGSYRMYYAISQYFAQQGFDMAFYPGEIHFFRRAFVLRDAWRRSDAFFYQHLMAPVTPLKSIGLVLPEADHAPAVVSAGKTQ
jgi:dipeptidyl aminopeptidase/acylaminoacyl peptidase